MMNLHEIYVAELGFKLENPGSAVRCATNYANESGAAGPYHDNTTQS